jgi:hypothetical protein
LKSNFRVTLDQSARNIFALHFLEEEELYYDDYEEPKDYGNPGQDYRLPTDCQDDYDYGLEDNPKYSYPDEEDYYEPSHNNNNNNEHEITCVDEDSDDSDREYQNNELAIQLLKYYLL